MVWLQKAKEAVMARKPIETTEPAADSPVTQSEGNVALAVASAPAPEPTVSYDPERLASYTTLSAKIRYLHSQGMKRSAIAKTLTAHRGKTVLYQHVRNVLVTPVKVGARS